jgi:hypothetical protein
VPAVVAGNANLRVRTKRFAGFTNVAIALPQMHAIGLQPLGKRDAVIHNERYIMRSAYGLQWFG